MMMKGEKKRIRDYLSLFLKRDLILFIFGLMTKEQYGWEVFCW